MGSKNLLKKAAKHIRQGTLSNAVYKKLCKNYIRKGRCKKFYEYLRTLYNINRYGWFAPRVGEIIWVNPNNCTMAITNTKALCGISNPQDSSGIVIESLWPFEIVKPIFDISKFKHCRDRYIYGIPWEKTGRYYIMEKLIKQKGQHDGCKNTNDYIKRYEDLDRIFEQVKKEGKLRKSKQLPIVHIGPNGKLYWGRGSAQHRTAIAHILGIPYRAKIGCVHFSAIPYLKEYRKG